MTTLVPQTQILEYIPQRPPMVMVDSLLSVQEKTCQTNFSIQADNILLKKNKLSTSGLVENIAQSAAASAGYYFKNKGEKVKLGFIGSVKKLEISDWPNVGDQITTKIEEINEVMGVKIIEGKVFKTDSLDNCIASCEMKIFLIDKAPTE